MRDDRLMKEMLIKNPEHKINFWVCEYQQNGGIGKVMRNIRPTYVEISMDEYDLINAFKAKNDYEKYHFNPIVHVIKKDKMLGKIISYYSTKAYDRGLYFFNTENEAIKQYNDLIFAAIESAKIEKENVIKQYDNNIESLQSAFIKSDYVMELLVRSN